MGFGMIVVMVWGLFVPGTQSPKDPTDVLRTLEEDLRKAIKTAAKDKDVRDKLGKVAKATFDRDITGAAPKVPKSAWEYQAEFLEHLAVAETYFKNDADKIERSYWTAACKTALTRQLLGCREAGLSEKDLPATDEVYYELKQAVARVEKRFTSTATEYEKAGYDSGKQVFTSLIARARAPKEDPKDLYAKWLVEIDRIYPTATDDQKRVNTPKAQLLKTSAKAALDRSLAASK
jgi:hypothetical protein